MKPKILIFSLAIFIVANCSNAERDACIKKCDTQSFTLFAITESNNANTCQNRNTSISSQTYDQCIAQQRSSSSLSIGRITTACKDSCYEKAKLY